MGKSITAGNFSITTGNFGITTGNFSITGGNQVNWWQSTITSGNHIHLVGFIPEITLFSS